MLTGYFGVGRGPKRESKDCSQGLWGLSVLDQWSDPAAGASIAPMSTIVSDMRGLPW